MPAIMYKNVKYANGGESGGGGAGLPMWRVLYYDRNNSFMNREYVRDGDNALYSYGTNEWAKTSGGTVDPTARNNVSSDLNLYYNPSISDYIPYSDFSKICCEAHINNFDSTKLSWGDGDKPITLSNNVDIQSGEDAVNVNVRTGGTYAYVDLGADATPFTAYFVAKSYNPTSGYARLLSAFPYNSAGQGQGIMLFGNPVQVSSWASDTGTGVNAVNNYWVGVIQFGGSGSALGKVNNSSVITKTPSNCGQYLTIGRTGIKPDINNPEPNDMLVKYLGVVLEAESQTVIGNNISALMTKFGIS